MRARRVLLISAALGVLVLLPVLVIVSLGIYGTSLGGSASAQAAAGARITLSPARGVAGDSVTIQGRGWPPRSEITVYVATDADNDDATVRLRLGKIETSRAGAFELQASVPRHLVAPGAEEIFFQAELEDGDNERHAVLPVRFALIPYLNTLRVSVVDADSSISLDGALIEIRDPFGQIVAAVQTDQDGTVEIAGIVPGEYSVSAAMVDFQAGASGEVLISAEGDTDISLSLPYLPGRRLFGLAFAQFEGGPAVVGGVDLASGLAVQEPLTVPRGRLGPVADLLAGVYYDFLLDTGGGNGQEILHPLLAVAAAGRLAAGYSAGNSTITRYVGESAIGTVVMSTTVGFFDGQAAAVVTLDSTTGRVLFRREIPTSSLTPVLSPDGSRMYVGDWLTGTVRVLDTANGDILARHPSVVDAVRQLLVDGQGRLLVLEEQTGAVRSLDPDSGEIGEHLLVIPLAQGMAFGNSGELLLISSDRLELMVANPDTGEVLEVVALQSPAGFIWPDPGGQFLIIGYRENRQELTFQVLDAQTYKTVRTVTLPLE